MGVSPELARIQGYVNESTKRFIGKEMYIAESRIVGLNVAHDGSDRVDVMIDRVLVSPDAARGLAVGDTVCLGTKTAPVTRRDQIEALSSPAQAGIAAWLPDPPVAEPYGKAVRSETPAFQTATDHEIGVGYLKGLTYQYAYPKGATPADACRWSHIDETEVREELWDIQPGDIVYDIGSAFGSYALSALAMGAAHVVCFNPNPQEQDLLLASARLNGWADKVTRHNVGLWSESGYLNDEEQTFTKTKGDFKVTKTADGRHTQLFEVRTLDSLGIQHPGGRAVWKIDTEGAELHVLRGGRAFLAMTAPALVVIEKHQFKDASLDKGTDDLMSELGYERIANRPYHSVIHAAYKPKGWGSP